MEMTSYEPGTPSWVDLGTPDIPVARKFYTELFGWQIHDAGPDAGGYCMAYLRDKPVAGLGPQQNPGPPYWTTYISVADADATAAAVSAAGGQVFMPPMDVFTFGRMAVFADAGGAPFAVWQPGEHIGAGLTVEPGTLCWNELNTREPDKAKAFYAAVFGWGAGEQQGSPAYTEWTNNGRTVAGMITMDESWPPGVPSHWMTYFAVADADQSVARVTELGGQVRVPPTDIPPGRFAVVADPAGAVFSVIALDEQFLAAQA